MAKGVAEAVDNKVAGFKKKLWCFCKCGTGWIIVGIITVITGICLVYFFSEYWGTENWKLGLVYTGIAFLIFALITVSVGIAILVCLCLIMRRRERQSTFTPVKATPGSYPTQPQAPPNPEGGTPMPAPDPASRPPVDPGFIEPQIQGSGAETGF